MPGHRAANTLTPFPRLSIRVAGVLIAVAVTEPPPLPAEDPPAIVQALDVGIARWRETVTFQASYRFCQGVAKRFEDGSAGKFASGLPPGSMPTGSGRVVKTESAYRFTFDLDSPPIFNRRTMTTKMVSADFGAANGIVIRYWPAQLAADKTPLGGVFEVSDGAKAGPEERYPDIDQTIPMPLLVCGTNQERPLLSLVARTEFHESIAWELLSRDASRTVLQMTQQGIIGKDSWREVRTYTVRTDAALPLIEAIDRTYARNEQVEMRERTEAQGLIDCGRGCLVPSRVVVGLYKKPLPGVEADESGRIWWVRVWESDDVGREAAGPEAFVYSLPEKTRVRGLQPKHATVRTFVMTELRTDDLDQTYVAPALARPELEPPPRISWSRTTLACASLLLLLGGGLCLSITGWRHRTARKWN